MKKHILSLGKPLNKVEQKKVKGVRIVRPCRALTNMDTNCLSTRGTQYSSGSCNKDRLDFFWNLSLNNFVNKIWKVNSLTIFKNQQMKKKISISIYILSIFFSFISCKRNNFTVKTTIKELKSNSKVYLFDLDKKKIIDSTITNNESFYFNGNVDTPFRASILIDSIPNEIPFWIEPNEKINLQTSITEITDNKGLNLITNGELNKLDILYNKELKPYFEKRTKAYKKLKKGEITKEEFKAYSNTIINKSYNFFISKPNNYFSLTGIYDYKDIISKDSLKKYYDNINGDLKKTKLAQLLKKHIYTKRIKEGDTIKEIIGKNLNGKEIKLSDFRGKKIVLDFWASWCPPCIQQINQELKVINNKFSDKNLQIINFSFDFDKEMWKKKSEELDIKWINFSNLEDFSRNEVAISYGITEIPTTFIINEDGIVLKKIQFPYDKIENELTKIFSLEEQKQNLSVSK